MRVKSALRFELKYLLDQRQSAALVAQVQERMYPDRFGDSDGAYSISSLYFDTPDYKAYWDKLEGHKVRRKVRVRTYGLASVTRDTPVYLEIKQRVNKLMAKRRALMPYATAVAVASTTDDVALDDVALDDVALDDVALDGPEPSMDDAAEAVAREVRYLRDTLHLQPACVVRYDRLAFEGGEHFPDLRVTFDTGLRGRARTLTLAERDNDSERQILSPSRSILEVKVNNTVPYWLADLLSRERCILQRISKYCSTLEKNAVVDMRQRMTISDPTF